MPRNVSLPAMQAAMAPNTGEIYLVLLKIDHADLPSPIRLVNNNVNITSGGSVYTAYPFEAVLPDDKEEKEPAAEIRIDNVDRSLMDEVRSIQSPPTITISVILASSPNTIEWGPLDMETRGVTYDAQTIIISLAYSAFTQEPFPYLTFDPVNFPGMFQ